MEVDRGGAQPAVDGEVLDRDEVGERGVVDQHIGLPVGVDAGLDDGGALVVFGDIAGHSGGLAAGLLNVLDGHFERAGQGVGALLQGARRRDHFRAFGRVALGDCRADAAARAGHDRHLAVQLAHAEPLNPTVSVCASEAVTAYSAASLRV